MPAGDAAIRIEDLRYRHGGARYAGNLLQVDGRVEFSSPGLTALQGRSGSGKTTLLEILTGDRTGYEGSVVVDGVPLESVRTEVERRRLSRRIGVIFQDIRLFDSSTVRENLRLVLADIGLLDPDEADRRIRDVLAQVELGDVIDTRVGVLSGGQKRRVMIAKVLVREATVIFADEPTVGVEPPLVEGIFALLLRLARDRPVVLVTHDEPLARRCPDGYVIDGGRLVPRPETIPDEAPIALETLSDLRDVGNDGHPRLVCAVVGAPSHGKSTYLASLLVACEETLGDLWPGCSCAGMDGGRLDALLALRAGLEERRLPPETGLADAQPVVLTMRGLPSLPLCDLVLYEVPGPAMHLARPDNPWQRHVMEAPYLLLALSLHDPDAAALALDNLLEIARGPRARAWAQSLLVVLTRGDQLRRGHLDLPGEAWDLVHHVPARLRVARASEDRRRRERLSARLSAWLSGVEGVGPRVEELRRTFADVEFCVVSATGSRPVPRSPAGGAGFDLPRAAVPRGVLDPVLWLADLHRERRRLHVLLGRLAELERPAEAPGGPRLGRRRLAAAERRVALLTRRRAARTSEHRRGWAAAAAAASALVTLAAIAVEIHPWRG